MPDFFFDLRWRIIIGLGVMSLSSLGLAMVGKGASVSYQGPSAEEREEARKAVQEYEAEREIRKARRTEGYDPSDPSVVRDGYQDEYNRSSYSDSQP